MQNNNVKAIVVIEYRMPFPQPPISSSPLLPSNFKSSDSVKNERISTCSSMSLLMGDPAPCPASVSTRSSRGCVCAVTN